ncbi:glycosyl transferase [Paenibacillus baekrokdamisoli]|uniref:Glycosyl transferase n=1 Tax=Paenibacillus baekrokdamisoli TaxID=1712516 RepID=A0A3G9J8A8_9BACL|nr:glycosyltransferase family 2 protein [Paenibacillus baekrokdamisoli]MBB3070080.1 GT2 family glycosyltransferase [Paenibacillus baekrokdamisoli]BBH21093.1 glycosyl transferase [Paenibacillus baekrokdamisoli]
MPAFISIVMLTRNALNYTKECIESVIRHTPEHFEFVFVDNGSTDGTLDYLQSVPSSKLICNEVNRGFAAGNNQGIAAASGDYICLLNNDTVVTDGWLTRLLAWLNKDPSIAIVGPRSNNVAWAQRVNEVTYREPSEMDGFAFHWAFRHKDQGFFPHKLIGHCMLFHKSLITRIGVLDERFFPGNYEDDDFCLRARISGKILWVANDVYIHHYGGSTFRTNQTNYAASALNNANKFAHKWSLGISGFELDNYGYNPSDIVEREKPFRPHRHYVPLK